MEPVTMVVKWKFQENRGKEKEIKWKEYDSDTVFPNLFCQEASRPCAALHRYNVFPLNP